MICGDDKRTSLTLTVVIGFSVTGVVLGNVFINSDDFLSMLTVVVVQGLITLTVR